MKRIIKESGTKTLDGSKKEINIMSPAVSGKVAIAVRCGTLVMLILLQSFYLKALELPAVFTDNMVLQRNMPVPVWGWSEPGKTVDVYFASQKKSVLVGPEGKWAVTLDPLKANSRPGELTVVEGVNVKTVKNVLVGEVWLCSGQSNMQWTHKHIYPFQNKLELADFPLIRQFEVKRVVSPAPLKDVEGTWAVCSPETAVNFSAVAYYFGLYLFKQLNIPIGLINSSWGGTRIEPWTDPEGFSVSSELKEVSGMVAESGKKFDNTRRLWLNQVSDWVAESRKALDGGSEIPDMPVMPKHPLDGADKPTSIYNAMIAPLAPYAIRGSIWYQGESNVGEGMLYYEKMKALIGSWRRIWNQGDFPFYYVQLAPWQNYPNDEALPGIWEAQLASLSIPNTGMVVTTDIGNITDIHPHNKEEVGRRLSLWALNRTYGVSGAEYSGPVYRNMKVQGNRIILFFDHADKLESRDGKPLNWFSIAGEDNKFTGAKAEIEGSSIVVYSEKVKKPVAVRFAWSPVAEPNLINGAGLPASPFRTGN
jgi:sialate O-acetylesterase